MAYDVTPIVDAMTQTNTVIDAAIVFIDSVPTLVSDAVSLALANGATAEQLAPVSDAAAALNAKRDALIAALAANTPNPPPQPLMSRSPVKCTYKK
jgi:hypothetical protein